MLCSAVLWVPVTHQQLSQPCCEQRCGRHSLCFGGMAVLEGLTREGAHLCQEHPRALFQSGTASTRLHQPVTACAFLWRQPGCAVVDLQFDGNVWQKQRLLCSQKEFLAPCSVQLRGMRGQRVPGAGGAVGACKALALAGYTVFLLVQHSHCSWLPGKLVGLVGIAPGKS